MPVARGVKGAFWHLIWLQKDAPWHHSFPTYEYEEPFRYGTGHVLHLRPLPIGIVVGRWVGQLPEEVAAFKAAQGHQVPPDVKGEGGESVEEHRTRRLDEAVHVDGWTVIPDGS